MFYTKRQHQVQIVQLPTADAYHWKLIYRDVNCCYSVTPNPLFQHTLVCLQFSRMLHIYWGHPSLSFLIFMGSLYSSPRMVTISFCMKAHGTLDPTRGHFLPEGQYTSAPAPCRLIESREQGKQNLWSAIEGHCTK